MLDETYQKVHRLVLQLNVSYNIVAFVHEPGFEIWSHHGLYPDMPEFFNLYKKEGTDIAIKKSVKITANDCINDLNYNRYQCLIEEFRKVIENLSINCVTPWTYTILEGKNIRHLQSCNNKEAEMDIEYGNNFIEKAANGKIAVCKGKLLSCILCRFRFSQIYS